MCVEYLGRLTSERVLMGYGGKFSAATDYVRYHVIHYGRESLERSESKGGSWKRNREGVRRQDTTKFWGCSVASQLPSLDKASTRANRA